VPPRLSSPFLLFPFSVVSARRPPFDNESLPLRGLNPASCPPPSYSVGTVFFTCPPEVLLARWPLSDIVAHSPRDILPPSLFSFFHPVLTPSAEASSRPSPKVVRPTPRRPFSIALSPFPFARGCWESPWKNLEASFPGLDFGFGFIN